MLIGIQVGFFSLLSYLIKENIQFIEHLHKLGTFFQALQQLWKMFTLIRSSGIPGSER